MELLFLGTGSANWLAGLDEIPDFIRRDSSVLIDSTLLIDPGPCVLEALGTFGCDAGKIKYIINTHMHDDHYCENTIRNLEEKGAEFITIKAGETVQFGKYTVAAFKGNHAVIPTAHFLISDGEREVYYGLDGAMLVPEALEAIKSRHTDTVILEGTLGFDVERGALEHNNMNMVVELASELKAHVGEIYISHISRKYQPDHETLSRTMSEYGVRVAYDGLKIQI